VPSTADAPTEPLDVPAALRDVIRSLAPEPIGGVLADDHLTADLGYHSLARVELMFALEDLFGLDEIPPERATSLATVGDIEAFVAGELDAGRGHPPRQQELMEITCGVDDPR
jgi:acyl carrier protein